MIANLGLHLWWSEQAGGRRRWPGLKLETRATCFRPQSLREKSIACVICSKKANAFIYIPLAAIHTADEMCCGSHLCNNKRKQREFFEH
jgi:hypothetical protein